MHNYYSITIYTRARRGTIGHGENVVVRRVFVIIIYTYISFGLIAQSCPRTGFLFSCIYRTYIINYYYNTFVP